ncbi:MAG: hypothetical protein KIT14_22615 [bacterium]|nr:hypothetical protein [bacterium]
MIRNRTACWCWTGARVNGGYGHVQVGGRKGRKRMAAHIAYELERGPWPTGMRAVLLCRNHACANPWHVNPSTHAEMVRTGRRRVCRRGHNQTPKNIYQNGRGHRRCRLCERELARERRRLARRHTQEAA